MIQEISENYYNLLLWSLIFNSILLFCLFSPNIVYIIHKKWFNWKPKDKTKNYNDL